MGTNAISDPTCAPLQFLITTEPTCFLLLSYRYLSVFIQASLEVQSFHLKFIIYYCSTVINHLSLINFIMSQRIPTGIFPFLETVLPVLILEPLFLLFHTIVSAHNTMLAMNGRHLPFSYCLIYFDTCWNHPTFQYSSGNLLQCFQLE